jgi:hypothetical protein
MGMGSPLMPKPTFLSAVKEGRALLGVGDQPIAAESTVHDRLVALLARRFTVSKQATRIRLASVRIANAYRAARCAAGVSITAGIYGSVTRETPPARKRIQAARVS